MSVRKATPGPRRVRAERGIYYRETPGGRVYEITYSDSTGRQRWQVVRGGIREARAERGEIVGRLGRGERVAPTKATLAEFAETWLEAQTGLRPRTRAAYRTSLRLHVLPRLGRRKLSEITEDDLARLIADLRAKGLSGWTVRSVLTPLGRVLGRAARRGLISANPMRKLERGERPSVGRREMRILEREAIGKLLAAATESYRVLLATAICSPSSRARR